ncbi:MAG: glycosyltransferase family 1 protein [Gammaproteobacteria bacterium]
MFGTRFSLEVRPRIPKKLKRLDELANNLLYSWDRRVRGLFYRLDRDLWHATNHSPKVFLRRVSQRRLEEAAEDRVFMEEYNRVCSAFDTYMQDHIQSDVRLLFDPEKDLVAYFCLEFGFHESLPLYSGGLGILAGDHCKAASDLGLPFVAIGLLYRQGYFTQTIDGHGSQIAHYVQTQFQDLPISPALDSEGREVHVQLQLPNRIVEIKVWRAQAGRITLYLLDTDLPANSEDDRAITYQLYGGDNDTRIQQEMVLGIGGARALRALGISPTVWHINEGHAAFMIIERCRALHAEGMDFEAALELTAANTVFTTHTPVPAGHDVFDHGLIKEYFQGKVAALGTTMERLLELGSSPGNQGGFNMTALALRGSRYHNGVSKIHGRVASRMEGYCWPQIPHDENPMGHITNGVHVPTFLALQWSSLFDLQFSAEWRNQLLNHEYWNRIDDIADHNFWSVRQLLKSELLSHVRRRAIARYRRNGCSEAQIERRTRFLSPDNTDTLLLGFARRFATYKRATLLLQDPERLARLLNDPDRPVVLIFAGKAHPRDLPGQQLIHTIHEYSLRPEFEGRIVLLEGYDLALARKLVTGVDVWVNTPEHPLEASGTSGEKAGINGVLNLSVLDGWWAEGYNGENGWGITPHDPHLDLEFRNREEGRELLDIIEHQVIPLYFDRDGHGFSEGWIRRSKASMKTLIPQYNAQRMVMDYVMKYYGPANLQYQSLSQEGGKPAATLAEWKQRIAKSWPQVTIRRLDEVRTYLVAGDNLPIEVAVQLGDLTPEDVVVECLLGNDDERGEFVTQAHFPFHCEGRNERGEALFKLHLAPTLNGLQYYKIRVYPYHPLLSHPFETGCMVWL